MQIDHPPTFKERVKHERELEIVRAACEVFAEEGFEKASIDHIAERVGIGKGTVYLHFSSKEALLGAVMRHNANEVVERCRAQIEGQPTAVEKLKTVLRVLTDYRYRTERLRWSISNELPGFLVQKEKAAAIGELSALIAGLVELGQAEGALNPGIDPRLGALSMVALVFVCPTHAEPLPKHKALDWVTQLYFHGISKEANQ